MVRRRQHAIEHLSDRRARQARGHLQDRTLPTPLIDHGEHAKQSAIGQRGVHEVSAIT